jgi:hypothetical protein
MIILAIVAVGAGAVGLAVYFVRSGGHRQSQEVCRAHCPRCDQRVRYSEARAGTQIACPRCRRRWTLPATTSPLPTTVAALRYRRLAGQRSA